MMNEQLNALPCGYFTLTKDWEFVQVNQAMKELLGVEEPPRHMHDILTVPSRIYFQTYFAPAIAVHGKVQEMYINLKIAGRTSPVLMNVNERNGLYEGVFIEIKERDEYEAQLLKAKKEAEKIQKETDAAYNKLLGLLNEVEQKQQQLLALNTELQDLATRDELTGLFNRRVFRRTLKSAVDRAANTDMDGFSLVLFDIDHFKRVNDTYGHLTGDDVLKELAQKLQQIVQPPHIAARVGGEEFAVIYDSADYEENIRKADELQLHFSESAWRSIAVTVSMGITHYKPHDSPSTIYARADEVQYASKRAGRDRLTIG